MRNKKDGEMRRLQDFNWDLKGKAILKGQILNLGDVCGESERCLLCLKFLVSDTLQLPYMPFNTIGLAWIQVPITTAIDSVATETQIGASAVAGGFSSSLAVRLCLCIGGKELTIIARWHNG